LTLKLKLLAAGQLMLVAIGLVVNVRPTPPYDTDTSHYHRVM